MRKVLITVAALLMLALPASAGAADPGGRWLTYPTCTVTTTALTCTGRAAVAKPRPIPELGQLEAVLVGQLRFTCTDPVFDIYWPLSFPVAVLDRAPFHNGQTFTLQAVRSDFYPSSITAGFACAFGTYTQTDPTFYNVRVVVGWGLGSASGVTVLDAPIGTLSPQ